MPRVAAPWLSTLLWTVPVLVAGAWSEASAQPRPCGAEATRVAELERAELRARSARDRERARAGARVERARLARCRVASALAGGGDSQRQPLGGVRAGPADASTASPFPPGTTVLCSLWARSYDGGGRVVAVEARAVLIELDDGEPPASRGLRIGFGTDATGVVALAAGARVRVHVTFVPGGAPGTGQHDTWITDLAGTLLFAQSSTGAPVAAGWEVTRGAPYDARGDLSALVLRHQGRDVTTDPNGWRTIATADGRWALWGLERVQGGRTTRQYTIVRLR